MSFPENRKALPPADILNLSYDEVEKAIRVLAELEVSDIQIGAVEIKDGESDTRVIVDSHNSMYTKQISDRGEEYSATNPPPEDIGWLYYKDVNLSASELNTFVGTTTGDPWQLLTSDLFEGIRDTTSNNPKVFTMWFSDTVEMANFGFGCNKLGENFSNIKMELLGSGSQVLRTIDESNDNTKKVSFTKRFPATFANAVRISFLTPDPVCVTNFNFQKIIEVKVNSSLSSSVVNRPFTQVDSVVTTLAVDSNPGDTSITVVSSAGFSTGDDIKIYRTGTEETQAAIITNIAANVITLDRPLDNAYFIGDTTELVFESMNFNGSLVSPESFKIQPPAGNIWNINRLVITMTHAQAADDSRFGGINGGLDNGVVLRTFIGGVFQTITVWKTNADMKNDMYDVEYSDKVGGGLYGTSGRYTLTASGFSPQLNGDDGDYIEVLIQDNLTGLTSYIIKGQGNIVK